jgi:hypothetical protein
LVSAKSLLSFPVIPNKEIVRVALPLFETVTVCGALVVPARVAKVRLLGESNTVDAIPVPVRVTACGLEGALS